MSKHRIQRVILLTFLVAVAAGNTGMGAEGTPGPEAEIPSPPGAADASSSRGLAGRAYKWYGALFHVNSNISAGNESPEEILDAARAEGIRIVFLADHLLSRGEYGLPPFRRLFRWKEERRSILTYGPARYLELVEELRRKYPDMVIIGGCDVAPFYYWTGTPGRRDFTVHCWSQQMVVFGLQEAADFRDMPLVANSYRRVYDRSILPRLWPFLLIALGIFLVRRRSMSYRDESGRELGPCSRSCRIAGIVFVGLGLVFLADYYPFSAPLPFDQYHGDQGAGPFQAVIDYVDEKGGITFWSEPEVEMKGTWGKATLVSPQSVDRVMATHGYLGLGIVYGDQRAMHLPGKEWDQLLSAYCEGGSEKPAWGMGESDYRGEMGVPVSTYQTVFLLPELSEKEVLKALASGRMYAVYNHISGAMRLDEFSLEDTATGRKGMMGEEVPVTGRIRILVRGGNAGKEPARARLCLVRNGKTLLSKWSEDGYFSLEYEDTWEDVPSWKRQYYRLFIQGQGEIVTNPIFVSSAR